MKSKSSLGKLQGLIYGSDVKTPLLDGTLAPYVNLDNAASTPPMLSVVNRIQEFLPFYSSVHRGTGFKSRLSTVAYDDAHEIVAEFVGADTETNTVIFGKNTTEAINKLSYRFPLGPDSVIITTQMEHHSNDLPWRNQAKVVHIKVTPEGRLDEADFDKQLAKHKGKIALVAVSAASNVTGFVQPIHRLARKTHEIGAKIFVDAAQFVAHRKLDMLPDDHPEHLDFVVLSAHKMYAPFGTGALIGPKAVFLESAPEYRGGGTVNIVTETDVYWGDTPDRDEAGSPNVVGAVALAAAIKTLTELGMDNIAAHEEELIVYSLNKMNTMSGVTIYGESDPTRANEKVGVIPFNLDDVPHFLTAAILGYEGGIGVRSGCFCAHPYVVHLLNIDDGAQQSWQERMLSGDKSDMPGMVRASFGCYNTTDDIDKLIDMLVRIQRKDYQGAYIQETRSGEFVPKDYQEPHSSYFKFS
ncbi:aminotransferase class V-fold PLP-dependent enzyme [bacterium AH-315-J21]|nr:aminotransferase class V-fold PLP-dependent enzyme [bacterium AH-315-J21]